MGRKRVECKATCRVRQTYHVARRRRVCAFTNIFVRSRGAAVRARVKGLSSLVSLREGGKAYSEGNVVLIGSKRGV